MSKPKHAALGIRSTILNTVDSVIGDLMITMLDIAGILIETGRTLWCGLRTNWDFLSLTLFQCILNLKRYFI